MMALITEFYLFVIASTAVVIAAILFVLYRKSEHKRRMLEGKTETTQGFSECEESVSEPIQPDLNRVNTLLRNKLIEELNLAKKIAYIHSVNTDDEKKTKECAKLFDEKIETILKWDSLYKLIDELHPGFRIRLAEKKPFLSEKERQMCCLVKTGFQMPEMASILGYSSNSVTSMKYKLHKKAGFISGSEFDNFLNGL